MRANTRLSIRRAVAGVTSALLLAAGLTVVTEVVAPTSASAAQNPTTCQGSVALQNGGFEAPVIPNASVSLLNQSQVPAWFTTDTQSAIELWSSGFNGVTAAAGRQFAELNAYSPSRLFQDVATTPGQTLSWSLKHRGRAGTDVMRVVIGTPTGTLVQSGPNLSDGTGAWGSHTGTYVVPAGQTVTRFGFEAVSSAGGNASVGNFLDDITFGTGPCLITTKSVANLNRSGTTAEVGDTLRYTVTTNNGGGNPSLQSVGSDVLPSGLDFVPGSLKIISGAGTGALTDVNGDDRGTYISGSRTVQVRLGDGGTATAGGSIGVGTSTTYTFDAKVNLSAAAGVIVNEARVAFRDNVVGQDRTSISQETQTPVNAAADLAITKTLDTAPLVAGSPVTFTIGVTNNGPQTATGVTVTDPVPAGMTDVTASSAGESCTVTTVVVCTVPDMPVGQSVQIQMTGTLDPSSDPGSSLSNTATVSGTRTDPDLRNNTASVSGARTTTTDVSIIKTFSPTTPVAGEQVTYTLSVSNAGPSEARDVVVTDPLDPDMSFVSATPGQGECRLEASVLVCELGTLAPGATAVQTLVVVDINPGTTAVLQNTATVTTSTTDTNPANNASSTSFEPDIIADMAVVKRTSKTQVSAGETLDFTLDVSNGGSSDAVNVSLSDTMPEGFTVTGVDGPPGATCTAFEGTPLAGTGIRCNWASFPANTAATVVVHAIVAADAPVGTVTNTAAVAAPAADRDTTNNASSVDVEVVQSADLSIVKTAPTTGEPGSPFTYTLTVTNAGPSVARGASLSDTLPTDFVGASVDGPGCAIVAGTVGCDLGDIAPGGVVVVRVMGTWSTTATGVVSNTATTTSTTPDPDTDDNTSTVTVTLAPSADVRLAKTTSTPTVPLGGEATFEVTVSNVGPSAAAGVVVAELMPAGFMLTGATPSVGSWSMEDARWTVGTLLPGESASITVTATVHAEGPLVNTATASSQTPDPDTTNNTGTAAVTVTPSADLSIVKTISANPAPLNGAVTYTVVVTNAGPSIASAVQVSDALPAGLLNPSTGTAGCAITGSQLECTQPTLAVGASFTATVSGTVDPSFAGTTLSNTATVTSTTPDPDPGDNTSTVTVPVVGTPQVELVKTAGVPTDRNADGRLGAGDAVDYRFTIRNTGDVTLTSAEITDPLLGGAVACAAFSAPLAPGGEVFCIPVTYTLTQADVDAGTVHNTASVTAQSAQGPATDDAEENVTIAATNSISLAKVPSTVVDVNGDSAVGAGDTVDYAFTVTNNGTTTLRDAVITDPMLGGVVVCPELDGVALAPGQSVSCTTITYTLTQEDVDGGLVHNEASVTAEAPIGTVTDTAEADVDITGTAAIELRKNVGRVLDTTGDGNIGAGDTITYSFTVYNRGTTTLSGVEISDPLLAAGRLCSVGTLAPGGSSMCGSYNYTLTQDDVEAEIVRNTATTNGTSPLGPVTDDASADVVITGTAAIELTKTAGAIVLGADGRVGAGDTVGYTFTIRNAGTTVLRDIVLDDPLLGGAVDCPALAGLELSPGDDVVCGPVDYVLTQQNVDDGNVHNVATVEGQSRNGSAEAEDDADVRVAGIDDISLLKSAAAVVDANDNGRTDADDTIAYTFTVTNSGTTTLTGITVSDPRLGAAVTCETTELAPGDSIVCTAAPAVLTQAEIDAGEIENTATATGTGTSEIPPVATDTVVTPLVSQPAVALNKTGGDYVDVDRNGKTNAGDTIAFRFTVTNTGAVTLTDVKIDDPKLGGSVDCTIPDLAPGATADCGPVTYALTTADVAASAVVNVATVSAIGGTVTVTAAATATVDLDGLAATGGVITGIGWALALLAIGALVLLIARVRRRDVTA
ncbi:DUF11 domain-containing protein [Microbacterium sp. MYb62]|uniref:DUF11 domain-containing protein n=1 Tax=Microbacterium sp. MYb62 TaxID=1848690 RepID=UPI000CFD95F0|nr:DUF11 domain-containing protein [Microbacterium sp. MYb62]PRB10646.1 hypothetical protein CQ042_17755 [Microbacterium sp. MYb62]